MDLNVERTIIKINLFIMTLIWCLFLDRVDCLINFKHLHLIGNNKNGFKNDEVQFNMEICRTAKVIGPKVSDKS